MKKKAKVEPVFDKEAFLSQIATHELFKKHVDNGNEICKVCHMYLDYNNNNPSDYTDGYGGHLNDTTEEEMEALLEYYMKSGKIFYALRLIGTNDISAEAIAKYHTDLQFVAANGFKKKDVAWLALGLAAAKGKPSNRTIAFQMAKENPIVAYRILDGYDRFLNSEKSMLLSALKKQYGTVYMKKYEVIPKELVEYLDGDLAFNIMNKDNMKDIPLDMIESDVKFINKCLELGGKLTENMIDKCLADNCPNTLTRNGAAYFPNIAKKLEKAGFICELLDYTEKYVRPFDKVIALFTKYKEDTEERQQQFYDLIGEMEKEDIEKNKRAIIDFINVEGREEAVFRELRYKDCTKLFEDEELSKGLSRNPIVAGELADMFGPKSYMIDSILKDSHTALKFITNGDDDSDRENFIKAHKLYPKLKEVILKDPEAALELGKTSDKFDKEILEALKYDYEKRTKYLKLVKEEGDDN